MSKLKQYLEKIETDKQAHILEKYNPNIDEHEIIIYFYDLKKGYKAIYNIDDDNKEETIINFINNSNFQKLLKDKSFKNHGKFKYTKINKTKGSNKIIDFFGIEVFNNNNLLLKIGTEKYNSFIPKSIMEIGINNE